MAFFRMFDSKRGVQDVQIHGKRTIIGREAEYADLILDKPNVSRMHAMLLEKDGKFTIKDMDSKGGTYVNKKEIQEVELRNMDSIQIGNYVLEFHIDSDEKIALDNQETDDENQQTMLSITSRFRPLPVSMGLNCRTIHINPTRIFKTGDTVVIGNGGVLICAPGEEYYNSVIMELEMVWPDGSKKNFLGEVMHDLSHMGKLGIKLHKIKPEIYEYLMQVAKRGSWVVLQKMHEQGTLLK